METSCRNVRSPAGEASSLLDQRLDLFGVEVEIFCGGMITSRRGYLMSHVRGGNRILDWYRRARILKRTGGIKYGLALLLMVLLLPAAGWGQLPQTIVFTVLPGSSQNFRGVFAGTSEVLQATASSGLPVTFSVVSGPAQVSGANGSTLTYMGVGTVVVQADQAGGNGYSAAPSVQSSPVAVTLLTANVGSSAPVSQIAATLAFTKTGTFANVAVLTQGSKNLDFIRDDRGTHFDSCFPNTTYTAGQTCTIHFDFRPKQPGIRYGGITLTDASGNLLANSYIYGYGVGPQVLYNPIVQSLVGNSLGSPSGVAINGNGDLFVSNDVGSGLTEIATNGTVTPIGNFILGKDVAVDGSGNIFLITFDTLYEVMAVDGVIPPAPVIRTLATGFLVGGGGLAVDGSGNAYIAQSPPSGANSASIGAIYVVYAVDGIIPSNSQQQRIGPLFSDPSGVAVDSAGNVYLSNGFQPAIFEMLAVNGRVPASPTVLTIGSGYVAPSNIRLDNFNNIFISDSLLPGILEFPAVNGVVSPSSQPRSLGTGFVYPQGLLVDDAGNVFVADQGYSQVVKLNYSSVPTLTFAPTIIGQTSADSPQAVTYTNAGNADLLFTPPVSGSNPTITPDFALGAASTCQQLIPGSPAATLPVGQSCTNLVSFTPSHAGAETGTLTTVDNNLSIVNATQVVQLNGTGTLQTPTIQFSIPNHFVDDPPFPVAAASTSPAALTYSIVSGPATLAGSTITLQGIVGIVTVQVSQPPIGTFAAATQTATFSVAGHAQTITFAQPRSPVAFSTGSLQLIATASSGLPVSFSVLSGPAAVSVSTLSFLGPGTVVLAADQAGNAIFSAAPEVTRSIIVSGVSVALTGTPNPVFLLNPVTLTANLTPIGGTPTGTITFLDAGKPLAIAPLVDLSATISLSTLPLGTHPITALYSGDNNFAANSSPVQNVLVQDFTLTTSHPNVVIFHGGTATYNLQVGPVGGPGTAASVKFAVSGVPSDSLVTFTPEAIPAGSAVTPVTLVIATPNYPVGPFNSASMLTRLPLFAAAFGVLGLPFWRRRTRLHTRNRLFDVSVVLTVLILSGCLLLGCGSGWKTQKYGLTVTATSGQLQRSVAVTLTTECKNLQTACPNQ